MHRKSGAFSQLYGSVAERALGSAGKPPCGCHDCMRARQDSAGLSRMILCPVCGNKRCPHATSHGHACTGSNAPGQAGSIYGGVDR